MAAYKVYLLWQDIADGRRQLRRFRPDRPSEFLGYEKQSSAALAWMALHEQPVWPQDAFRLGPDAVPFCVVSE